MKKNVYTMSKKDIADYLSDDQPHCEPEGEEMRYFIHFKVDGSLVEDVTNADITLVSTLCSTNIFPPNSTMEIVYAKETLNDEDFSRMIDDFYEQINELRKKGHD